MSATPTTKEMFAALQSSIKQLSDEVSEVRGDLIRANSRHDSDRGSLKRTEAEVDWLRRQVESQLRPASSTVGGES